MSELIHWTWVVALITGGFAAGVFFGMARGMLYMKNKYESIG